MDSWIEPVRQSLMNIPYVESMRYIRTIEQQDFFSKLHLDRNRETEPHLTIHA
jgi:hypothetical protein